MNHGFCHMDPHPYYDHHPGYGPCPPCAPPCHDYSSICNNYLSSCPIRGLELKLNSICNTPTQGACGSMGHVFGSSHAPGICNCFMCWSQHRLHNVTAELAGNYCCPPACMPDPYEKYKKKQELMLELQKQVDDIKAGHWKSRMEQGCVGDCNCPAANKDNGNTNGSASGSQADAGTQAGNLKNSRKTQTKKTIITMPKSSSVVRQSTEKELSGSKGGNDGRASRFSRAASADNQDASDDDDFMSEFGSQADEDDFMEQEAEEEEEGERTVTPPSDRQSSAIRMSSAPNTKKSSTMIGSLTGASPTDPFSASNSADAKPSVVNVNSKLAVQTSGSVANKARTSSANDYGVPPVAAPESEDDESWRKELKDDAIVLEPFTF